MKRFALLAATVLCMAVAVGCGSGGSASGGGAETGVGAGTGTVPAAGEARAGGTAVVGSTQGIPQLNPAIRTFAWEEVLFPLMWNGLAKFDAKGEVQPDLATRWTASEDLKTWTFELRDGVVFSDGSPVDARAVKAAFEYYLDRRTPTQEATKIAAVRTVRADGPATVRFTLGAPNASFPAAIVNVKVVKVSNLRRIDKDPIVTGPYTVADFVPDDHVTLKRNPRYTGEQTPLDEIRIVKVADPTAAVTALRSGDLDLMWGLPYSDAGSVKSEGGLRVVTADVPSQWFAWELDTTSPPFDDPDARRALAYAVDRESVLAAAYSGQGTASPSNTPLSTANPWFGGELQEYPYDVEKARELFAKAGVRRLTWWGVSGSYPEWKTTAELLQESLGRAGVELDIQNREISTWAAKFYPAGKRYPGLIVPNMISLPSEPSLALNFLKQGSCECNWDSPEYERAFEAALGTAEDAARKEAWGMAQAIVSDQVPLVLPLQTSVLMGVRDALQGAWSEGGGQLHLESAYRAE